MNILGKEYQYNSPILPHLITGDNGHIIMPRVLKSRDTQSTRFCDTAESSVHMDMQCTEQPD